MCFTKTVAVVLDKVSKWQVAGLFDVEKKAALVVDAACPGGTCFSYLSRADLLRTGLLRYDGGSLCEVLKPAPVDPGTAFTLGRCATGAVTPQHKMLFLDTGFTETYELFDTVKPLAQPSGSVPLMISHKGPVFLDDLGEHEGKRLAEAVAGLVEQSNLVRGFKKINIWAPEEQEPTAKRARFMEREVKNLSWVKPVAPFSYPPHTEFAEAQDGVSPPEVVEEKRRALNSGTTW